MFQIVGDDEVVYLVSPTMGDALISIRKIRRWFPRTKFSIQRTQMEMPFDEMSDQLLEKLESPDPDSQIWVSEISAMALKLQSYSNAVDLAAEKKPPQQPWEFKGIWPDEYSDMGKVLLVGLDLCEKGHQDGGLAVIRTAERAFRAMVYWNSLEVSDSLDFRNFG